MLPKPSLILPTLDGQLEVGFNCAKCNTHQDKGIKANYCYACGTPQDWDKVRASDRFRISNVGSIILSEEMLNLCNKLPYREQPVLLCRLETELITGKKFI